MEFVPVATAVDWSGAEQACRNQGMALAFPQNAAEFDAFRQAVEAAPSTFGSNSWRGFWMGVHLQNGQWASFINKTQTFFSS